MNTIGLIYTPSSMQRAGALTAALTASSAPSLVPADAAAISPAAWQSTASTPDKTMNPAPTAGSAAQTSTATAADPTVQAFCDAAWRVFAVRGSEGKVFGEQAEARRAVLGEPRLNRPYPDTDLQAAGLPQDLPLTVTTPFKWLLHPPVILGDKILFHAQHEGGPGFCDNEELECRDLFITLQRDPATGRFMETGHLQTRPSEYAYVYRSTGSAETIPGSDRHFMAHIEEGSYSTGIFARHTHLYRVDSDAITEVAQWDGHLPASDDSIRQAL